MTERRRACACVYADGIWPPAYPVGWETGWPPSASREAGEDWPPSDPDTDTGWPPRDADTDTGWPPCDPGMDGSGAAGINRR